MPDLLTCACGKQFPAPEGPSGSEAPCPDCGKAVVIAAPARVPDVFVSYSSRDADVTEAVVASLEAQGLRCWVAPRDILPGKEWTEAIMEGIGQARLMVLVFSEHSNDSPQVRREAERAVHKDIPIVPFRIANVQPSGGMEYLISSNHWLDAFAGALDVHLETLGATTRALLEGGAAPRRPAPRGLGESLRGATRALLARDNRPRVLVGLTLLLLLVGAAVVGVVYSLRDPQASPEVVQARAEAEVLAGRLAKLDRDDGFGPQIDEVERHLKAGQAQFDQKRFADALTEFEAIAEKGNQSLRADEKRKQARARRASTEQARAKADRAGAARSVRDLMDAADAEDQRAERAFRDGDFERAARHWESSASRYDVARQEAEGHDRADKVRKAYEDEVKRPVFAGVGAKARQEVEAMAAAAGKALGERRFAEAVRGYEQATRRARDEVRPRLKALAFWLGFAGRNVWFARANDLRLEEMRKNKLLQVNPFIRFPPEEGLLRQCVQVLEEQCGPQLGFEQEVRDLLNKGKSLAALTTQLLESNRSRLRASLGLEVGNCQALGNNLAVIVDTLKMGALYHDIPDYWRGRSPDHPLLLIGLQQTIDAAYGAGCPAETVACLERARARYEKGSGVETRREMSPIYRDMLGVLRPFLEQVRLGELDACARFFRKPAAVPPTVPGHEDQLRALRAVRASRYFDASEPGRPLVRVDFLDRLTDPDKAVANLRGLRTVRRLDLGSNPVTDEGIKHIEGLTDLRELDLNMYRSTGLGQGEHVGRISDAGLASLRGLSGLEKLVLFGVPMTDAGLAHLAGLTNLRELDLRATRIAGPGLIHLAGLTRLQKLNLEYRPITDADLKHLAGLKGMKELKLSFTKVSDAGLVHLRGMTTLSELSLRNTSVTAAGVAGLRAALPKTKIVTNHR